MNGSLYDVPLVHNDGSAGSLGDYRSKVLLIVNVASLCGFTPQYEDLVRLHGEYRDSGLEILAFPSNDFLEQEPGSDADIATLCGMFEVRFPVFRKTKVVGPDQHELYRQLARARPEAVRGEEMRARLSQSGLPLSTPPDVSWNFEKFLVGRDGQVRGRFASSVAPDDPELIETLRSELARPAPATA
jgi:glutathione peroxidase